jgi:hypothetical protein
MGSILSHALGLVKDAYGKLTLQQLLYLELAATLYLAYYGSSYFYRAYK